MTNWTGGRAAVEALKAEKLLNEEGEAAVKSRFGLRRELQDPF